MIFPPILMNRGIVDRDFDTSFEVAFPFLDLYFLAVQAYLLPSLRFSRTGPSRFDPFLFFLKPGILLLLSPENPSPSLGSFLDA